VIRIVIETEAAHRWEGGWKINRGLKPIILIPDDAITRIEEIPNPLPTEPGKRFWGKTRNSKPQWWFVRESDSGEEVWYLPAHSKPDPLGVDDVVEADLICLQGES